MRRGVVDFSLERLFTASKAVQIFRFFINIINGKLFGETLRTNVMSAIEARWMEETLQTPTLISYPREKSKYPTQLLRGRVLT